MKTTLNITSGDSCGDIIRQADIPGDVFVWHDILYDGPRTAGWPGENILEDRADFIVIQTAGGLDRETVLQTFKRQYRILEQAGRHDKIILWFDACLFDQSMLVHILTCLDHCGTTAVDLLVVDTFPGIQPYNGLGQLTPEQMESVSNRSAPVTAEQIHYAGRVDRAFACQDIAEFKKISAEKNAPLPWVPAAVRRWLDEQPDPRTGMGKLETLALKAIENGCATPKEIFTEVAAADTPPQYWGDTTLWAKINGLADQSPPLVKISGPQHRLPQFFSTLDLSKFIIERTHHGL